MSDGPRRFPSVDTTDWLIVETAAGPVIGSLLSPLTNAAVLGLARARARRVEYVPTTGPALFYAWGVRRGRYER
jgi:hypothetical protein